MGTHNDTCAMGHKQVIIYSISHKYAYMVSVPNKPQQKHNKVQTMGIIQSMC